MSQKNIWKILEIPVTTDIKQIRQAYAAKAKEVHPEEHPETFMELQNAYQQALHFARKQVRYRQNQTTQPNTDSLESDHDAFTQEETPEAQIAHTTRAEIKLANPSAHEKDVIEMRSYFTQADEQYRNKQQETIEQTIAKIETLFHQEKAAHQEWNALLDHKTIRNIAIREDFIIALNSAMQKAEPIPLHAIMALSFFYQDLQNRIHDDAIPFSLLSNELDRQSQIYGNDFREHHDLILRNIVKFFLLVLIAFIFFNEPFLIGAYLYEIVIFYYYKSDQNMFRKHHDRILQKIIKFFIWVVIVSILFKEPFLIGAYLFGVVIFFYSMSNQKAKKAKNDKKKQIRLPLGLITFIALFMIVMIFITLILSLWS